MGQFQRRIIFEYCTEISRAWKRMQNILDWVDFEVLQPLCIWFTLLTHYNFFLTIDKCMFILELQWSCFYFGLIEVISKLMIDASLRACTLWIP